MTFEVVVGGDCPVVRVVGELDANTVPGLEAALAPIVSGRSDRLTIDASRLEFVDSSGIALWVRWSNFVGRLEIEDPPVAIRAGLVRLGLAHRLLPIAGGVSSSDRSAASDAGGVSTAPQVPVVDGQPDRGSPGTEMPAPREGSSDRAGGTELARLGTGTSSPFAPGGVVQLRYCGASPVVARAHRATSRAARADALSLDSRVSRRG